MTHSKIIRFLEALRESADIISKVYDDGSCYRLFLILRVIEPGAIAYWSDRVNHCITKIADKYYDIGGEISSDYVEAQGFFEIPKKYCAGYKLLKYMGDKDSLGVTVEKYI